MDKTKIRTYRNRLTEEQMRLMQAMRRNRAAADDIHVEHTEDEGDLAIISHDRELLFNLNESDATQLNAIRRALDRIDQGQFGECLNCEEGINEKRLAAIPWGALCIRCQEEVETEHQTQRYMAAAADPEPPEL